MATATIQQHNERPAAVWSSGGKAYEEISRGIADAIEHCVMRLNPQPGERILDSLRRFLESLARRADRRTGMERARHAVRSEGAGRADAGDF